MGIEKGLLKCIICGNFGYINLYEKDYNTYVEVVDKMQENSSRKENIAIIGAIIVVLIHIGFKLFL